MKLPGTMGEQSQQGQAGKLTGSDEIPVVGTPEGDGGRFGISIHTGKLGGHGQNETTGYIAVVAPAGIGDTILDNIEHGFWMAKIIIYYDPDATFGGFLNPLRPGGNDNPVLGVRGRGPGGKPEQGLRL